MPSNSYRVVNNRLCEVGIIEVHWEASSYEEAAEWLRRMWKRHRGNLCLLAPNGRQLSFVV